MKLKGNSQWTMTCSESEVIFDKKRVPGFFLSCILWSAAYMLTAQDLADFKLDFQQDSSSIHQLVDNLNQIIPGRIYFPPELAEIKLNPIDQVGMIFPPCLNLSYHRLAWASYFTAIV